MSLTLPSKPGLDGSKALSIPKDWSASWYRDHINNLLKGADVRNAIGTNGVTVTGNISSPFATIGLSAPALFQVNRDGQNALVVNEHATIVQGTTTLIQEYNGTAVGWLGFGSSSLGLGSGISGGVLPGDMILNTQNYDGAGKDRLFFAWTNVPYVGWWVPSTTPATPKLGPWSGGAGAVALVAVDLGNAGMMSYPDTGSTAGQALYIMANSSYDGSVYRYKTAGAFAEIALLAGSTQGYLQFLNGVSGAAGAAVSVNTIMNVGGAGGIGGVTIFAPSTAISPLTINGTAGGGGWINGIYNANTGISCDFTNNSTGTVATSQLRCFNSVDQLNLGITSTGYTGHVFTGDPSGEFIFAGTSGSIPFSIGTNSIERIRIASNGDITINAPSNINPTLTVSVNAGGGAAFYSVSGSVTGLLMNSSGSNWGMVQNDAANQWSLSYGTNPNALGTQAIIWQVGGKVFFPNISTTASAANAFLDNANTNNFLRSTSSRRYKQDIRPLRALRSLFELKPITYRSKAAADDQRRQFLGFVAEDVAEADPRLVNYDARGNPDGVQYERLTVLLVAYIQRLHAALAARGILIPT